MGKYLKLHERLLEEGLRNGLCGMFGYYNEQFNLFKPPVTEYGSRDNEKGIEEGYNSSEGLVDAYWAGEDANDWGETYTPLRQNIVLLIAAMNNEL